MSVVPCRGQDFWMSPVLSFCLAPWWCMVVNKVMQYIICCFLIFLIGHVCVAVPQILIVPWINWHDRQGFDLILPEHYRVLDSNAGYGDWFAGLGEIVSSGSYFFGSGPSNINRSLRDKSSRSSASLSISGRSTTPLLHSAGFTHSCVGIAHFIQYAVVLRPEQN